MGAYYNEFDPKAATWLRQLIKNGVIADGEVDERSIIEVQANDIRGFTQHHFFAGIGGWSYALRLAGWSDTRPVCTASLPCQPFSVAGAQKGVDDERHLLPHFIELVKQCNFQTIFGEQVPGAIKHGWLDDLCTEMEREKYRVGQIVLTAAGEGAPISDKDCTGWPTPMANNASKDCNRWRDDRQNGLGATASIASWPTTSTRDWKGGYQGGRIRNGKLSVDTLDVAAQLTGWRTPSATDSARGPKSEEGYLDCIKTGKHAINLNDEAKFAGWPTPRAQEPGKTSEGYGKCLTDIAGWATPNCMGTMPQRSDEALAKAKQKAGCCNLKDQIPNGQTQTGYIAETKSIGQLNPALSRWLMGFPEEWDIAAIQASRLMPTTRKKRESCD